MLPEPGTSSHASQGGHCQEVPFLNASMIATHLPLPLTPSLGTPWLDSSGNMGMGLETDAVQYQV